MSELSLSVEEFERLLSRGRGKAILHLKQHDAAPYREVIRRLCLTDTIHDLRCEATRAPYLMQAIELSGDTEAICDAVIRELHTSDWGVDSFFSLLGQMAQHGFPMARQAMYAWCRLHYDPQRDYPENFKPLLELDGLQAFLFLLDPRHSGIYPNIQDQRFDSLGHCLAELEERFGEADVQSALDEAARGRPALRQIIDDIYARQMADRIEQKFYRIGRINSGVQDDLTRSYAELRRSMDLKEIDEGKSGPLWRQWASHASDEELYAAAVDFNTRDMSLGVQLRYANLFLHRPFPLNDLDRFFALRERSERFVDLAQYIHYGFLKICEQLSHPRIRAFALDRITQRQEAGRMVALLANNFEAGDWMLIDSLFDADLEEYDYHFLGFSIQAVFKNHSSPDAIPALIRMFEANPCSTCRMDVVESLVSLNALPNWIAEECFYEANLELRAYAERGFAHASDD
jgi:hypothetical protein